MIPEMLGAVLGAGALALALGILALWLTEGTMSYWWHRALHDLVNPYRYQNGNGPKVASFFFACGGRVMAGADDPCAVADEAARHLDATKTDFLVQYTFGMPLLTVTGRDATRRVLSAAVTLRATTRNIGAILPVWNMLFGDGLFMLPPDRWKRVHRIALRGFGTRHTRSYYPTIRACALEFVAALDRALGGGTGDAADADADANTGAVDGGVMADAVAAAAVDEAGDDTDAAATNDANGGRVFLVQRILQPLSLLAICRIAFGLDDAGRIAARKNVRRTLHNIECRCMSLSYGMMGYLTVT